MAAGLSSSSFFTFHGTYGNQTENNVNIFLTQSFLFDFFVLLPKNHVSLTRVAAVGTKNYVIATSSEVQSTLNMSQQEDLYPILTIFCTDWTVLYTTSTTIPLYCVILTTVREARMALLSSHSMERQDCLMSICFIICSAVPIICSAFLLDVVLLSLYVLFIMLYTVLLSLYAVRLSLYAVVLLSYVVLMSLYVVIFPLYLHFVILLAVFCQFRG